MDKSRNINRQKKVEYSPLRIYELARMPWWVAENWRASWGDRVTLIPRIWSQSYTQAIRFTGKYLKLEKSQNSRTRKSLGFLLKSFKKMWSSWSLNKESKRHLFYVRKYLFLYSTLLENFLTAGYNPTLPRNLLFSTHQAVAEFIGEVQRNVIPQQLYSKTFQVPLV